MNSIADTDDGACTVVGIGNGCTLREAINAANLAPGADTITFAPALTASGAATITLSIFFGDISTDLNIVGPGGSLLTIERSHAGGTPDFGIFNITNNQTVSISGLTIANASTVSGGAINNQGTLTLTSCSFFRNLGDNGSAISNSGLLVIDDCQFGGTDAGQPNDSRSTTIANSGTLRMNGGSVVGNHGTGIDSIGILALSGVTLRDNNAFFSAGGLYLGGTANITNCSIVNNTAAHGGGGGIDTETATVAISNSTISGNLAAEDGGGIWNDNTVITLTNVTITNNRAIFGGGGIQNSNTGSVILRNSIVAGNFQNSVQSSGPGDITGVVSSLSSNNLIGIGGAGGLITGVNNNQVGIDNPRIGPLANNGGPTQTHALLPGSPAIDAGSNALLPADTFDLDNDGNTAEALPFDQRGLPRVTNTTVDIGAFESRGFTIAVIGGTPQSTLVNTSFGSPLAARISSAFAEPVDGGIVIFRPPASGASGSFSGGLNGAISITSGGDAVSPTFTANNIGGTYLVTAGGSGITNPASFALTNLKHDQTITFGALANKTFGDADFNVGATCSSNLTVSFAAAGDCSVTGSLVHLTGAGSCTITASQAGDSSYNPAPNVQQSFSIAKAASSTTVSSSVNPSDLGESVTFTANVSANSGLTPMGSVQFMDGVSNLGGAVSCTAGSGNTCTAQVSSSSLAAGNHVITATYSGDANFLGSSGVLSGGQVVRTQPSLSINDVSMSEGDSGTKNLAFTVTLSAATHLQVKVDFATANGTAIAPSDYQSTSGALLFTPGSTTQTIAVLVNGDQLFEPDETFLVNLSNPVNATISDDQGLGTITNDDAQGGFISFSQSNYPVSESAGFVTITVNRTNDTSRAATIDYATGDTGAPATCGTVNGLASSRCDFTRSAGTLTFAAGDTQKTFSVLINRDTYVESAEMFTVNLSNATGGAILATPFSSTVTINDDNTGLPANAIDDPGTFVRMHYHDFLNREADQSGLNFWTGQMTNCGTSDLTVCRVNVSGAFFLSIEFQQTGYLVERIYKTAYGDATGTSTLGGSHQLSAPVVRFNQFLTDTQRIGRGVVVLAPGWEQALENNKQAYALEFVQTSRFITALPTSMTPAQFVDKLNQNAGNVLSTTERTTAINLFNLAGDSSNTTARAQVLRQVAEDPDLFSAEFNRAFVLTEFFGYLRRNPDDLPDSDYTGYEFWLTKLNQFNGDYIGAEMVKAFIASSEYRQRFGP